MLALGDLLHNLARVPGIFPGADIDKRVCIVQQMMRDFRAFGWTWLGRADFKIAVHRHRVAIDDLALKAARQFQRERGLSAGGRAQHRDQQRLVFNMRQSQRALQGMYCQ